MLASPSSVLAVVLATMCALCACAADMDPTADIQVPSKRIFCNWIGCSTGTSKRHREESVVDPDYSSSTWRLLRSLKRSAVVAGGKQGAAMVQGHDILRSPVRVEALAEELREILEEEMHYKGQPLSRKQNILRYIVSQLAASGERDNKRHID